MTGLAIAGSLLLLLVCYDVANCVAFYFEANRQATSDAAASPGEARSLPPDQVAIRHAFLFLIQKANYYWQLITAFAHLAKLHLRPRPTTDLDVARHLLNTSLVTWVKATPQGPGVVVAALDFAGFAFQYTPDRYDNRLVVELDLRLRSTSLSADGEPDFEARVLRFALNGTEIASRDEQLSILAMMVSSVTHPVIHSFHNALYRHHADPRLRRYEDLFLHGQYLNWCAWYFPGILFRIPGPHRHHWFKRVLEWNARLPLPADHGRGMVPLAPYSRFVRFILAARPMMIRLCQEHGLPLPVEALFVCTVLHACDHANCDIYTRGHLLRHEQLSNKGHFNMIALLFYRPAQHFWTNLLKDKRRKTPFYEALYAELQKIDPRLADQVTLSISY